MQVSLTQTAMWYLRLGMNSNAEVEQIAPMGAETNIFSKGLSKDALYKLIEEGSGLASESGIEHFFESHDTDYGKMRHLAPVLQMSATKPYWSSGARPLGSDLPIWE